MDYSPALLIAALFFCLRGAHAAASRWSRRLILGLTMAACVWGSTVGTALSINSYNLGLKLRNPAAFRSLVAFFGGNPGEILYAFDVIQFQAKAIRSGPPGNRREILLTTGSPRAADFIFVQYTGPATARFGYQHGSDAPVLGPEVGPLPNPFDLGIDYGGPVEKRRVEVTVNGTAVFTNRATFYFTTTNHIGVGRDLNGSPMGLQPFGGALQVKRMGLGLEP
jgi:hypothetical protein